MDNLHYRLFHPGKNSIYGIPTNNILKLVSCKICLRNVVNGVLYFKGEMVTTFGPKVVGTSARSTKVYKIRNPLKAVLPHFTTLFLVVVFYFLLLAKIKI